MLSLLVILGVRLSIGEAAFADWGWRIPFLVSILLLGVSLWIRLKLAESPAFQRMKAEGKGSTSPLKDSFGKWPNLKLVLIALFGLAAGQAVVWYTGQFYALFFLERTLKVDGPLANTLVAVALLLATPFFVFWGWLSDKIGRKPIILAGCLLAALLYFPLFHALTDAANPRLAAATAQRAGQRPRRPGRLLGAVRSGGQDGVQPLLRRGQVLSGAGRDQLRQRRMSRPGPWPRCASAIDGGASAARRCRRTSPQKTAWEKALARP
jgi:MFS family permease